MKPGEYVGADGVIYRYRVDSESRYIYCESVDPVSYPPHLAVQDARAAGHALIALADELETKVVELLEESADRHGVRIGIRGDEMWLETKGKSTGGKWAETTAGLGWPHNYTQYAQDSILAAYRAGLAKGTP